MRDNSPEEIRDLALEVLERSEGRWVEKPEDKELQNKFWKIFLESYSQYLQKKYLPRIHGNNLNGYVNAKFLRENKNWLK